MEESVQTQAKSGMSFKIIGAVVVVIILAAGGYFLVKGNKASQSETQTTMQQESTATPTNAMMMEDKNSTGAAAASGSAMAANTKSFTVVGSNFAFSPKEMTVKKGDTVKVTFTNSGGTHDFVIDEFNVRTNRIKGGQSEDVTFVASKSGTFEYYCSVGNHRQMGMVGKLIVQ